MSPKRMLPRLRRNHSSPSLNESTGSDEEGPLLTTEKKKITKSRKRRISYESSSASSSRSLRTTFTSSAVGATWINLLNDPTDVPAWCRTPPSPKSDPKLRRTFERRWSDGVVNGGKIIDMLEEISMVMNLVDFAIVQWLRENYVEPFGTIDRTDALIVTDAEDLEILHIAYERWVDLQGELARQEPLFVPGLEPIDFVPRRTMQSLRDMPHGARPEKWCGSDMSHKNGYEVSKKGIYRGRWIDEDGWERQLWSAPDEYATESSISHPDEEDSGAPSAETLPLGERELLLPLDEIPSLYHTMGYESPSSDGRAGTASDSPLSSVPDFLSSPSPMRTHSLYWDNVRMFEDDDEAESVSSLSPSLSSSLSPSLSSSLSPSLSSSLSSSLSPSLGPRTSSLSPSITIDMESETEEESTSSPLSSAKTMSDGDGD